MRKPVLLPRTGVRLNVALRPKATTRQSRDLIATRSRRLHGSQLLNVIQAPSASFHMSFGFGVGDFLAVLELAGKVRQKWVDAPPEYDSIKNVTKDFGNILRDLDDLKDRIDLTPERETDLKHATANCLALLTECERLVDKYSSAANDRSQRSKLRRTWKRLKSDPEDVRHLRDRFSAQIQQLNTLQLAINTDLQSETNEGVNDLQHNEAQRKRELVADWYSSRSFADQQTDQLARRHADTGTWFLQHPVYQYWRDEVDQILLCPGIPGSGKSVLVATIVDNLLQHFSGQHDIVVVYLYCNFNRQSEQSLAQFLSCLVRQLFQERSQLPEQVDRLYLKHRDRATRPSVDELKQLLHELVCEYGRVFIVIDALDEYANTSHARDQFLDGLFGLQNQKTAHVNLLATSRPILEITDRFASWPQVEIRANVEDIERYIDDNISRLPSFVHANPQLQNEVKHQIASKAGGMFLLARLQFDSLHDKVVPRMFHTALFKLKGGSNALDDAYDDALNRIEQQREGLRDLALLVLTWITYARRELHVEELQEAIAIWPEMTDIDHENDLVTEQAIGSVCAGLVVIDPESRAVRLVHYTTQKYLEEVRDQRLPGGATKIAQSCWTYLNMEIFEPFQSQWRMDFAKILQKYKLLDYIRLNWASHASESGDASFFDRIHDTLLEENRLRFIAQATLAVEGYDEVMCHESEIPALHVCAHEGLTEVAKRLIVSGQDIKQEDGDGQTPLVYAVHGRHSGMLQLLLAQLGIEVNQQDRYSQTVLWHASSVGHLESVRLLLAQPGIEINVKDPMGTTPLFKAAERGRTEVVQLLLAQPGMEVNVKDQLGMTPLSWAAKAGCTDVVQLLLAWPGIEVNVEDQWGVTPLSYAAECGHTDVVQLLLAWPGIEINTKDDKNQTPLSLAAANRHKEVVQLLTKALQQSQSNNT